MFISLVLTADFISKSCEKEEEDLSAFLKIILYEDPYIILFKNPNLNRSNIFKQAENLSGSKLSGSKKGRWEKALQHLLREKRFIELNNEFLKIAKSDFANDDNLDESTYYKRKSLENKIFSSSTVEHSKNETLFGLKLLGKSNQIQELNLKEIIKNNCRIKRFDKADMNKDLFIERFGAYTLVFNTIIIFDKFLIKPYEKVSNNELDGEAIFEISKIISISNIKRLILISAEYWEKSNPQNGYKLITNKKKCLDKYLVEINKNLNHFNKNIECEILLIKETLCSDKHFRSILCGNYQTSKPFSIKELTKENRASFIPIQLDNGCNYFKKNFLEKNFQFKYMYKEDMDDFFDSLKNITIHKLKPKEKEYWETEYNSGWPWINAKYVK